jgi:tRNA pseudouridine38-40 synthase
VRTVAGTLERALQAAGLQVTGLGGSGRTDAGVHALGQVVHFDVPDARAGLPWRQALNSQLPEDMAVVEAGPVPDTFHARVSATAKTYAYTLWLEPGYILPQRRPFVWARNPLDLDALDRAAGLFVGRRDFAAFMNVGTPVKDTVREILSITRSPGLFPQETVLRFRATGFLKQMARNIVGCLVAAGRGKLGPDEVRALLAAGDRSLAPATAPARGLCLESVEYGG